MSSLTPQTAALNVGGSKRTAAPDAEASQSKRARTQKRADYISWDGTCNYAP